MHANLDVRLQHPTQATLPCNLGQYPTARRPYRPHPATTELCLHVRCPKWLARGGTAPSDGTVALQWSQNTR